MRPPLRSIVVLAMIALAAATLPGAVPSYEATWQFAVGLQTDYPQDRANTFITRLDGDLVFRRMVAVLGEDVLRNPQAQAAWEQHYRPTIVRDLTALAAYETLFVDQVALVEGERVLQCILSNADGRFTALVLWLEQRPDGSVAIVDYRTMAQLLAATRRMRALIVYLGGVVSRALDEEELALAMERSSAYSAQQAFAAMGEGKPDDAFQRLLQLPLRVRQTRLWRDLRDGLSLQGCAPALASALTDASQGQPLNPVIALQQATIHEDNVVAIAAFRSLAERSFGSSYIRALHAGALLHAGRAREALSIAEELYQLNPFSAPACSVAVRAAARLDDPDKALAALAVWSRLAAPDLIDRDLAADPALTTLRGSAAYRTWLELRPAATVTAEP